MRYQKPARKVDYFLLFTVISLGVASGNLLSTWITARIVAYQVEQASLSLRDELNLQATKIEQQNQQRLFQTREQRATSQAGRFLSKNCEEWKAAHQQFESFTSQQEMDKACKRYSEYLRTGHSPIGTNGK